MNDARTVWERDASARPPLPARVAPTASVATTDEVKENAAEPAPPAVDVASTNLFEDGAEIKSSTADKESATVGGGGDVVFEATNPFADDRA